MGVFDKIFAKGLLVLPASSVVLLTYTENLLKGKNVPSVHYCTIAKDPRFPSGSVESSTLFFGGATVYWVPDNSFTLSVWEGHPGPRESDFIAPFQTLSPLLDAAIALYFGQPTVIDSWIVPFHHHPELHEAQVRQAIRQAPIITPLEFELLEQKYQRTALRQFPDDAWEQALVSSFLRLAHTSEPKQSCMLLRNAQVAFIVQS